MTEKKEEREMTLGRVVGICSIVSAFWGILFSLGFYLFYSNASGRALEVRVSVLEVNQSETKAALSAIASDLTQVRISREQIFKELGEIHYVVNSIQGRR